VIGIDIGQNSFHVVGLDQRGAVVLRKKWSGGQLEMRLAYAAVCLIGLEACVGAHHLSRKLRELGHDARLMPAKYVRTYSVLANRARGRAISSVNFLGDKSFSPYMTMADLCAAFEAGESTVDAKARVIE
jgi:transposase